MGERDKSTVVDSTAKLKREDYQRTKDDSAFYDWKILIGPTDWEDHLLKKEGAEKYRTHNLPNCPSCSGLYELGVALLPTQSGREVGKLKKRSIIPVYIGQADNVRTRLQHYGREGSHLENSGFSKGELEDCKRNGLFRDIFARGFSIVYRWAPMENKSEAERKEAQLLDTFDYAWNKGSNGARRPNDIHQKLYSRTSKSLQFPLISKMPQFLPQRQVFNVPVSKLSKEVKVEAGDAEESKTFYNGIVCGVDFEDGTFCTKPPVLGRHRCEEHKGMRVKKQMPKSKVAYIHSVFIDTSHRSLNQTLNRSDSSRTVVKNESSLTYGGDAEESRTFYNGTVCGVYFEDGTFCTKPPVLGRHRCEEHKSMRVKKQMPKSKVAYIPSVFIDTSHRSLNNTLNKSGSSRTVVKNESSLTCGATTLDGSFCKREPGEGGKRCWQHEGTRVNRPTPKPVVTEIPTRFTGSDVSVPTCGATTQDGSFCRRKPGEGGKRCWQHKGTRANGPAPEPVVTEKPSRFAGSDVSVSTCGATTQDGSSCRRKPSNGSNWCWQHAGTRVASNSRTSVWYEPTYNDTSYRSVSYFSSTCGAITHKGTYCSRAPAAGRRRCWQH